ncbi:MAG: hypothetical protein LBL42_01170 [Tannerella sp.]|jgi:hypothetical protein|nr:hypothetical protein [Tannerella sp.]
MTHTKHSLFPRTVEAQVADLKSKRKYLEANAGRLGISPADRAEINAKVDAVIEAHARTVNLDTRTKIDVATRNCAIRTAQDTLRTMINYYVTGKHSATEMDYLLLNIPRRGPHTQLSPPDRAPGIGRITSANMAVLIPFFDAETGRYGKPEGVQFIEVAFKLDGEMPEGLSEMPGHREASDSPLRLQFELNDDMKVVYLILRWVGTRGDYGPWSKMYRIIITR